jgi:hypothetical protein
VTLPLSLCRWRGRTGKTLFEIKASIRFLRSLDRARSHPRPHTEAERASDVLAASLRKT